MPFTLNMPKLSPTMEEGTVAKWHKKAGDKVESGELLLDIATDKATVEYNFLEEGYLRKILVAEGKTASVNQPIAIFTEKLSESIEGFHPEGAAPKVEKKAEAPIPAPRETSQAPAAPVSARAEPRFVPEPPLINYRFSFPSGNIAEKVLASPLAKKIAQEKGLDLTSVKGSGPKGRIVSRDLDLAQPDRQVTFGRRELPEIPPGTYKEVELTPMRKIIGQRLQESKSFIPHFYVRQEIDAAPLFDTREQMKSYQIHATINDFIIRAAALSLRDHPMINSGFHSIHQSVILFQTVDIAVAVSVEGGLFTPIIRHADYKNIGEISVEMKELSGRAKSNELKPEEYKGGSFTISNLGMLGVSEFVPIINPPQTAILGVGGIEECVRIKNGRTLTGKKMQLTLASDHRVVDGVEAAKFIKTLQKYLENPTVLLI
jgi:pyruvate dehydrogenase E2 component (dihydrolipoamide acetyltransferase)